MLVVAAVIAAAQRVRSAETVEGGRSTTAIMALTFDDLPFASGDDDIHVADERRTAAAIDRRIRAALARRRIPATGFVNEFRVRRLGPTGLRILSAWNRGSLELGNHGAEHADSNLLSLEQIDKEVSDGESTIRPLAARSARGLPFYRFPFNHVGDTDDRRLAISRLLAGRGYRLAASTIDTSDYLFDQAYRRAKLRGDTTASAAIQREYLDYTRLQTRYYRNLNVQVLGYEPPEVMLLHFNELNSLLIDRLIDVFLEANYRFTSLSRAQSDPAYRTEPGYSTKFGPMWGYRWARERGVKVNGRLEKDPPQWVSDYAAGKDFSVPAK